VAWRFRHSFKVIPGVRLNLSKSGLSASIGGAPFTLNLGPRGFYGTASIPGTGISYRQPLARSFSTPHPQFSPHSLAADSSDTVGENQLAAPAPVLIPATPSCLPIEEVRSASTELLTSESLKQLKRVIQTAHEEYEDISRQLAAAQKEKREASQRYLSWQNARGFSRSHLQNERLT